MNNLNLARKWRPQNFKEIIGQDIPVKMLLNSLYLEKLFPVYLFAGQRGCGKTSTARILGAAINCKNFNKFKENPQKNHIPCLECNSCKAMAASNHPDFIEIDAASHTGVENVRQILESCSYMPILGKKKIYLIDEAHMLSKAAFNAFLKILEEPPSSTLFILATTEIQKFPATVLSRCFQVIFESVNNNDLKQIIKKISINENIKIEDKAIDTIVQETEGSVRDAINMLERVRFSETKVTIKAILKVLGKVSETEILDLFEIMIDQNPKLLIDKLNSKIFENINPSILWNMILETIRAILWVKFKTKTLPSYFNNLKRLTKIAGKVSINRLNAIFQLFWTQEDIFLKTPNKKILLETILLQVCQQVNILDLEDLLKNKQEKKIYQKTDTIVKPIKEYNSESPQTAESNIKPEGTQSLPSQAPIAEPTQSQIEAPHKQNSTNKINENWKVFLNKLSQTDKPFLVSILSQAKFLKFNSEKKTVEINLLNDNSFIRETIEENQKNWLPLLKESYPKAIKFEFIKKKHQISPKPIIKQLKTEHEATTTKQTTTQDQHKTFYKHKTFLKKRINKPAINISNKEKWPKANLIIEYFPGKVIRHE